MLLDYPRASIKQLAIAANKRRKFELDKTLDLEEFINSIISDAKKNDPAFQGSNKKYKQEYPRTIRVAPSIKEMLDSALSIKTELDSVDIDSTLDADSKVQKKLAMLKEVIQPKQIITIKERPDIWWGDTLGGINGRVGYVNNDRSKSYPFKIGGTQSHVCAGGNTGQGKSVMMDAFIQSLLAEYPPWELGLFLVDMKMLEHAKYATTNKCPQIRNIGITGSSTYITSVLKFVDSEMKDFYSLCSIVGPNTIAGVREALDLYIPRVLVVMDEFSQLNESATNEEKIQVEYYLQSIVKLGRAVGYHLLPTSQTFRGAISKDSLGQFAVGMAVGSNEDNSEELIGNTGAVALKEKIGYCIINTNRKIPKNERLNNEYKVAYLDIEKPKDMARFQGMLQRVCDYSHDIGFDKVPTVFNEKTRRSYKLLASDIQEVNNELLDLPEETRSKYFMDITLGNGMVYSGKEKDKVESFPLTFDKNSNIFISGISSDDVKYLLKLVGRSIDNYVETKEEPITVKMIIDSQENYFQGITRNYKQDLTGLFNLTGVYNSILNREMFLRFNLFCKSENREPSFIEFIKYIISNKSCNHLQKEIIDISELATLTDDDYIDLLDLYESVSPSLEDYPEIYKTILSNREYSEELLTFNKRYMNFMSQASSKYLSANDFKKNIFFFFEPQTNDGITNKYGINETFLDLLSRGPTVGVFSVVIIKDPKGLNNVVKACTNILTGKPPASLENLGIVKFLDSSGIALKYTKVDGDINDNKYFKKYLYRDDEFLTIE